jgi:hypothetical protein
MMAIFFPRLNIASSSMLFLAGVGVSSSFRLLTAPRRQRTLNVLGLISAAAAGRVVTDCTKDWKRATGTRIVPSRFMA